MSTWPHCFGHRSVKALQLHTFGHLVNFHGKNGHVQWIYIRVAMILAKKAIS